MRYLGVAADAVSEVATFDQLPAGSSVSTVALSADAAYTTAATDMTGLSAALTTGTWIWDATFVYVLTGTASVTTMRMNFTGTAGAASVWSAIIGSAGAGYPGRTYNADTALTSIAQQFITASGIVVVTAGGTLTPNFKRASSTTGVLKAGSNVRYRKVA